MKYFSPTLLDGSVTEAKIATSAVSSTKFKAANASQSGTIPIDSRVTILLNVWSIFPHIDSENPSDTMLRGVLVAHHRPVPAANPTTPQFDIMNQDPLFARLYDVAWFYYLA